MVSTICIHLYRYRLRLFIHVLGMEIKYGPYKAVPWGQCHKNRVRRSWNEILEVSDRVIDIQMNKGLQDFRLTELPAKQMYIRTDDVKAMFTILE